MRGLKKMWKGGVVALGALLAISLAAVAQAQAPPALPTIVTGSVTIDGAPAPAGAAVVAWIGGENCGSATTAAGGTYTVQVGGRPGNAAACDQANASISFTVNGKEATGAATRIQGALQTVNLVASTATPTPAPTPAPTATPAPTPAGLPPTGVGSSDGGSTSWWPVALGGAVLAAAAGAFALRRRTNV